MVLQTIDLQCFIYSKGSWKIIERVHNVSSTCAKKRASMDEGQGTPVKKGRPRGMSLLTRYPPLPEGDNDAASTERN